MEYKTVLEEIEQANEGKQTFISFDELSKQVDHACDLIAEPYIVICNDKETFYDTLVGDDTWEYWLYEGEYGFSLEEILSIADPEEPMSSAIMIGNEPCVQCIIKSASLKHAIDNYNVESEVYDPEYCIQFCQNTIL